MEKVGRNDPCPCGSGKKFKKCCELKTSKPSIGQAQVMTGPSKTASLFHRHVAPISVPKPPATETSDEVPPDTKHLNM